MEFEFDCHLESQLHLSRICLPIETRRSSVIEASMKRQNVSYMTRKMFIKFLYKSLYIQCNKSANIPCNVTWEFHKTTNEINSSARLKYYAVYVKSMLKNGTSG